MKNSDCFQAGHKTMVLGPGEDVSGPIRTTTTHMHSAQTTTEQPLPKSLNLHAWYLGVQHSKNMDSLDKWQKELMFLRDPQQEQYTHPS